jgi:anti-anti-sigma regulatory factor
MVQIAHGWELDIDRGPDWLFVRPHSLLPRFAAPAEGAEDADMPDLADDIWLLVEQNFARRLVLELDDIGPLDSFLVGQLVRLYKRFCSHGRVMRISGLSGANQKVLDECQLSGALPCYDSRGDAVKAARPMQPR